ncbi:MAG TPA: T9SS type A sorting domain-containing protein, partial [Bacteroidota bacterium]|nr:T9SS type A sorting domain-containing protein [Bacteroidota bacterium]
AGKIYFVHDAPTSPDSISVSGNGVVQIVVQKRQDGDGNPATTGDQTQKRWHLSLYQTSVSPANLLASGDTSDLVVPGLSSGTYIAVEADSGLAWHRINGNLTQSDTVSVSTTAQTIVTFVNFRPNSLAVSSLEDNDGNFGTTPDQTAKTWHLEIHQGSPSGPIVALGDTSVITAASLGDGTYYAVEADSTGWIHLGYDQNGTPVSSPGMNSIPVVLAGGADATIAFVNAPPVYSTLFRTFRQDSIAYDRDNKNALGKPVKLKPDKVDFSFQLVAPIQAVTLSLKLSITSSGVIMAGADTVASWTNAKTVTTGAIPAATLLNISGRGFSGKAMKASYVWATTPKTTKGNVTGIINVLRDPMPNRVNALFETYNRGAFTATSGLLAGRVHTDSSKYYGWVLHKKYGDILKSLYDSKSVPPVHDGIPHGFDFTKAQAKLPRSKSNNVLFADLVALKVNIAASAYSVTTPGLGELVYDDGTSNPMNGKLVKEIAAYTDSAIIGYYQTGLHLYLPLTEFKAIDSAIANINSAFEGPLDTVSFSGTLLFKGVKRLVDVPFLHASPQNPPYIAHPVYQGLTEFPQQFTLYQNYPNPFNPTTTIQFDLPVQAYVTLRVYNLLGQVVATLIDHQLTSDGSQEVPFDGSRLASGVYFYRMTAEQTPQNGDGSASVAGGTVQMVRKMLLIK